MKKNVLICHIKTLEKLVAQHHQNLINILSGHYSAQNNKPPEYDDLCGQVLINVFKKEHLTIK